jgi:predicted secreted protein
MAIQGKNGTLEFDSAAVAQVRSFTINETQEQLNANSFDDPTWDNTVGGRKSWTATVEAWVDPTAGTGNIDTLVVGAEVLCAFYPEGNQIGGSERSGNARVETIELSQPEDGLVSFNATLRGVGELSAWGTVT